MTRESANEFCWVNNTQDPEAGYNVKIAADGKRKTTYGYKMHANTDEDGFVKKMAYTPGNVHNNTVLF
jgi:IS5 family transposase